MNSKTNEITAKHLEVLDAIGSLLWNIEYDLRNYTHGLIDNTKGLDEIDKALKELHILLEAK